MDVVKRPNTAETPHPVSPDEEDVITQKAAEFLNREGSKLHPALSPQNGNGLEQTADHQPKPFENELTELYTNEFKELIEEYRTSQTDPKLKVLENGQSWADVLREARDAEGKYSTAGKLRKMSRIMTDRSAAALPYARMIPNDKYFAVLSAGVRIVIEAASNISKLRQDALQCLLRIPFVIVKVDNFCLNFERDPVLSALAEQVYRAALAAIQGTIGWLSISANKKAGLALLKGPLYAKTFDDQVRELENAMDRIEGHVDSARDRTITHISHGIDTIGGSIRSLTQAQEAISRNAVEEMKKVLRDTDSHAKWMKQQERDITKLKERIIELESAAMALTSEDLIEIFDAKKHNNLFDLRRLLKANTDPEDAQLALMITKDQKFQAWQQEDHPSVFLVEIRGPPMSHRHISATSLASSWFVESKEENPKATTIYFFCGQHTSPGDDMQGPQGMMRSLLTQVLQLFTESLKMHFISARLKKQLENLNFRALCECFSGFVKQLPISTVLFCVIDGINFFEANSCIDDTFHALQTMQHLTENPELKPIFKVLVTSPVRTRHISEIFTDDTQLTIRADGENARNRPTEREVAEATRRSSRAVPRQVLTSLRGNNARSRYPDLDAEAWDV